MVERQSGPVPRILVVDDDPSVLAMLRAVLESEGHEVVPASSVAEARRELEAGSFEMVITDIRMETETAGFDVVRAARARPESPAIIILTAYPMLEQQWREAGAHAGLMKGIPVAQLMAEVDRLLVARAQHK